MANKQKDFGQKQGQPGQQGMQDDRSDRESAKPVQLDEDKMNEKQGGEQRQGGQQHQGGQNQPAKPMPQGGQHQPNR